MKGVSRKMFTPIPNMNCESAERYVVAEELEFFFYLYTKELLLFSNWN